jgi:hypothetical protein
MYSSADERATGRKAFTGYLDEFGGKAAYPPSNSPATADHPIPDSA